MKSIDEIFQTNSGGTALKSVDEIFNLHLPNTSVRTPNPAIKGALSSEALDHVVMESVKSYPDVDPTLLRALIMHESGGNPNAIPKDSNGNLLSSAKGLGQLIDATAKEMGVRNPFDPYENAKGAAGYLSKQLKEFGNEEAALAAYFRGPTAVRNHLAFNSNVRTMQGNLGGTTVSKYLDSILGKKNKDSNRQWNPQRIIEDREDGSAGYWDNVEDPIDKIFGTARKSRVWVETRSAVPKEVEQEPLDFDFMSEVRVANPAISTAVNTEPQPEPQPKERKPTLGDRLTAPTRAILEEGKIIDERWKRYEQWAAEGHQEVPQMSKQERQLRNVYLFNEQQKKDVGGARAFLGSIRDAIPGMRHFETEEQAQIKAENPVANITGTMIGAIGSTLAGAPAVGRVLSVTPKVNQAMQSSALARTIIPRVVNSTAQSVGRDIGIEDFQTVFWNAVRSAGGSAVSVVPEVYAPANVWQLIAQPAADLAFDLAWAKATGENIRSTEWWVNEALSLGVSSGFAIRDIASGQVFKTEQAKQRSEIKSMLRGWKRGKGENGFQIVEPNTTDKTEYSNENAQQTNTSKPQFSEDVNSQRTNDIPPSSDKIELENKANPSYDDWRSHIQEAHRHAERLREQRQIKELTAPQPKQPLQRIGESPKQEVDKRQSAANRLRDIPEEAHTPEFLRERRLRELSQNVYDILKESGHRGWQEDYQVMRGGTRLNGFGDEQRRLTETGRAVLDQMADGIFNSNRIDINSKWFDDASYNNGIKPDNDWSRAGLDVPKTSDDIAVLVQSSMNNRTYKRYANDYAKNYWDTKKQEPTNRTASDEAWRVLENEPHKLTAKQRTIIETDLEADLIGYLETMGAPKNLIDAVRASTENPKPQYNHSNGEASYGEYSKDFKSGTNYGKHEPSDLRPIERAELVHIVKELLGDTPSVNKFLRSGAHGLAMRQKQFDGEWEWKQIKLRADIFKDPEAADRVLAHEIGHILSKYGGDGKYKTIATKIKNAAHEFRQFIENDPAAQMLTPKDRQRIRNEVTKLLRKGKGEEWIDEIITKETKYTPDEVMAVWNSLNQEDINPVLMDYIKGLDTAQKKALILEVIRNKVTPDYVPKKKERIATGRKIPVTVSKKATPEEIAAEYRKAILREAELRRLTELKTIYDELYQLSKKWRPFDENKVSASHLKYRQRGEEVFADGMSVLLNDPDLLKYEAPTFWRVFNGWENHRNPFTEVYKSIQGLYSKGDDAVFAERDKRMSESFAKSEAVDKEAAKAKEKEKPISQRGSGFVDSILKKVVDKYIPIKNMVRSLEDAGLLSADNNPYFRIRKVSRVSGQQEGYLGQTYFEVEKALGGNLGKQEVEELGKIMTLNRMVHERKLIANPWGLTPELADKQLGYLKKKLGEEKYGKLQEASKVFNRIRQETIIPVLEKSGMLSPELLTYVKENPYYSTFRVVRMATKDGGAGGRQALGLKHQTGTLKDIENPLTATLKNDAALLRTAARNDATRSFIQTFISRSAQEITGMKVTTARRGSGGRFIDLGSNSKERTVYFIDNGKMKAYNIDRKIADCLLYQPEANGKSLGVLMWMGNISRDVFVNKNPGFWVWNVQRDIWETTKNLPGKSVDFLPHINEARKEVYNYLRTGELSQDLKNALRDGTMVSGNPYTKEHTDSKDSFHRMMSQYIKTGDDKTILKYLGGAWDGINRVLEFQEKTMKLAGYKYMTHGAVTEKYYNTLSPRYKKYFNEVEADSKGQKRYRMNEELRDHFVRTQVGTSDIVSGGTLTPIMNNIFLFSNSAFQGMYGSVEAFKMNPKAYMKKMLWRDVLPKAAYALAGTGLLSPMLQGSGVPEDVADEIELAYQLIDDRFKGKFEVIPLFGLKPNGRQAFIPLPKSYEGMNIGELVYRTSQTAISTVQGDWENVRKHSGKAAQAVADYNPISETSILPVLQAGMAWIEWGLLDKNPVDPFTGRPVIAHRERGKGTGGEMARMGKHTWNKLGGTAIYKFDNRKVDTDDTHWVEKMLGMPVVGPALSRVVRLSEKTEDDLLQERKKNRGYEDRRVW